jgi:hypothetical protein
MAHNGHGHGDVAMAAKKEQGLRAAGSEGYNLYNQKFAAELRN